MQIPSAHGIQVSTGIAHRIETDRWFVLVRLTHWDHGVVIRTEDHESEDLVDEAVAEASALAIAAHLRSGWDPANIVDLMPRHN